MGDGRSEVERDEVETIVRSNGWFEIRNTDDRAQWIATDSPTEVRR